MISSFLAVLTISLFLSGDLGRGRAGDVLYVHHLPDPVNVRTGNFYLPVQDYFLSCFGFPLEVYRSYNSVSTRNGVFGKGWTFNHDVRIAVDSQEGMRVTEADGYVNDYIPVEAEKEDRTSDIQKIIDARKKEDAKYLGRADGKGQAFYDTLRKQLNDDLEFFGRQRHRYLSAKAKISKSGKYVSRQRGTTYLDKTAKGYVRTTETGRREEYNEKGLLTRLSDRNDNELTITYDTLDRFSRVKDGCGQFLAFKFNSRGKISEITDSLSRNLKYDYSGDLLISAVGLDGAKTSFQYDLLDRMNALVFSDGTKTEISYDSKTGYVTKQSGPGTKVTTYTYGRIGKVVFADVADNEGAKSRYEYNDPENQIIFVEKSGKKTITTVSECCGKPLSIKDEKGVGEEFKYDDVGNLVERIDPQKKKTLFKYEPRFHLPSEISEQGGATLRFLYDRKGNLTYATNTIGTSVKLVNEKHGKIEKMTDHNDTAIQFSYNSSGKPIRIEKRLKNKMVGAITVTYERTGDISNVDYEPKKPEVIQEVKDTLAGFLRLLKPSGVDFEI